MEALATRCALFLAQIALFSNTGMQSRNLYFTSSVLNKSFITGFINECSVCNAVQMRKVLDVIVYTPSVFLLNLGFKL